MKSAESGIVHEFVGFDLDVHGTFHGFAPCVSNFSCIDSSKRRAYIAKETATKKLWYSSWTLLDRDFRRMRFGENGSGR